MSTVESCRLFLVCICIESLGSKISCIELNNCVNASATIFTLTLDRLQIVDVFFG